MNTFLPVARRNACFMALLTGIAASAFAAPGAHGPNGEHLDEKTSTAAGTSLPRIEAKSELFELVANLKGGELTIMLDRYETNEPVLGARIEVESGPRKAPAAFRAESGDYAVTDAALLQALAAPGEHALVFTVSAGPDADLLDGTLVIGGAKAATDDHGHSHATGDAEHGHGHGLERAGWVGAGVLALGLIVGGAWWRQRRRGLVAKGAQS